LPLNSISNQHCIKDGNNKTPKQNVSVLMFLKWNRLSRLHQGMEPQEEMLAGLVLGEVSGGEQVVSHFPAAALSVDPAQRFAQLFAARGCWVMKDLQPFLQGLQVGILLIGVDPLNSPSWNCMKPRGLNCYGWGGWSSKEWVVRREEGCDDKAGKMGCCTSWENGERGGVFLGGYQYDVYSRSHSYCRSTVLLT